MDTLPEATTLVALGALPRIPVRGPPALTARMLGIPRVKHAYAPAWAVESASPSATGRGHGVFLDPARPTGS